MAAAGAKPNTKKSRIRLKPAGRGLRLIDSELDGVLLGTVIALLVIGLLMMFSASYPAAIEDGLPGTYYAKRQLVFAGIGLAAVDKAVKEAPVDIVWYGSPSHNLLMMNEFSVAVSGNLEAVKKVISVGKEIGCELLHTCGIKPISVTEVSDRYGADHVIKNYSIDACK